MNFHKDDAYRILSNCTLSPRTAQIADYWLSLWDADGPPPRASIAPSQIKPLLPGVMIFRVAPGRSVTVRMAGTNLYALLKFELTGSDWLSTTPCRDRSRRLAVFSDVAQGNVALGRWNFPQRFHRSVRCEKLLLPLRPIADDDGVAVLGFVDWAPGFAEDSDVSLKAIPLPEVLARSVPKMHGHASAISAAAQENTGGHQSR